MVESRISMAWHSASHRILSHPPAFNIACRQLETKFTASISTYTPR